MHIPRVGNCGSTCRITVDIVFDITCPWCYVGKRRLDMALERRPAMVAELRWRPFLLNPEPDIVGFGLSRGRPRNSRRLQHVERLRRAVRGVGQNIGIPFAFEKIVHSPPTLDAHRLIRLVEAASGAASARDAVETLMAAFFVDGRDISDPVVLADIGEALGLPRAVVEAHLDSSEEIPAVLGENLRAHRLGVNGVPCFIFNDVYAMAGAQDVE
ncbi:MAG: DsbA family oxidoreductase, partial [Alphaproteobacteria bacterium]